MQSKRMSALESVASTAVGYLTATAANFYILPFFVSGVTWKNSSVVALIFTAISLVRGYVVRRFFNWLGFNKKQIITVTTATESFQALRLP